jgi:Cd2+/Zn2+-exporting ATPase
VTKKANKISRRHLEISFTIITFLTTLLAFLGEKIELSPTHYLLLFVAAFLFGGVFGLIDGIKAGWEEHKLDVNLLMILAAVGAAIIGQPLEGAILLFLFSLSNTLQTFALERNRVAIKKLLDYRPQMASVRRGSRIEIIAVEKVMVGDTVLVRPGDRMPVDGDVISGETDVNQATITGESLPVHKRKGDQIFAGTVNGFGALEIRTTHMAQDTTLARIVQMVEQAQKSRAHTQTILDRFEQFYAWFVLAGAILLILVPLMKPSEDFFTSFYRAMTWLVVASPCALVISTPASILSAIANGARNGILFKGGVYLEQTAALKVIAFDKTGTLTNGRPSLQSIFTYNQCTENELLRLVAAAEARSEHSIGQALIAAAENRGILIPNSSEFYAIPGQGIEAIVEGKQLMVGNSQLFNERSIRIPDELIEKKNELEQAGQTVMLVYATGQWLGLFAIADTLRPDAGKIIQSLKAAGIKRTIMLTGDNEYIAKSIAAEAGVDEVYASLLPQDKVRILENARKQFGKIAMIGDGVNDAPALAVADVGIAMGGAGSDIALETADIVLMADDLSNLPHAIRLARQSRRIIWQNLGFSLAVIVFLVISAFGLNLSLPLGVVGHEGSTVLVVLNGLRLLGLKKL